MSVANSRRALFENDFTLRRWQVGKAYARNLLHLGTFYCKVKWPI
ncbi:MAG: hypothetical protein WCD37_07635 [Chloroflexia bacterium]